MRARVLIVPLALFALSGCGILSPQGTNPPSNPPNPNQNPGQGQAQPLPPQATSSVAPTDLPILATRTTADQDIKLEVSLREVRTGTGAMTVTFSVTNRDTNGKNWAAWEFFDDGISQISGEGNWTADGVAVIDTVGAKRYLPARTADHRCMCSQRLSQTTISPDQTVYLSAVYQGLPAEVTKVSVDIPHAGVFGDVPVTR